MTSTGNRFKWMLWPPNGRHLGASDEFIADGFLVQLSGGGLDLTWEAPGACSSESARALADRYAKALGTRVFEELHVLTEPDWLERTRPPFQQNTTISTTREDWNRAQRAVREARNELLANADATLRQCYDHLQDAREHEDTDKTRAAVSVYKAMEELEERFGGEQEAVAKLGKQFKDVKRAANESRHIEGKWEPMPNPPTSLVGSAVEVTRDYERYLLKNTARP